METIVLEHLDRYYEYLLGLYEQKMISSELIIGLMNDYIQSCVLAGSVTEKFAANARVRYRSKIRIAHGEKVHPEIINLPTEYGNFKAICHRIGNNEHLVIFKGDIYSDEPLPVYTHAECLFGDIFHSVKCGCHKKLGAILEKIESTGRGLLLYLREEDIGLRILYDLDIKEIDLMKYSSNGFESCDGVFKLTDTPIIKTSFCVESRNYYKKYLMGRESVDF
ncbi:MAG: hypothetical protein LBS29_04840 [Endomicrobium sp.]|jgi:GTP cyclohydrolase II|nr:hypothetical protein [Endomicrobium sp.]